MAMHAKPRETCWFQHKTCWLYVSLLVIRENLLVLCNEFGFGMLNPFFIGSKIFVLIFTHSLIVSFFFSRTQYVTERTGERRSLDIRTWPSLRQGCQIQNGCSHMREVGVDARLGQTRGQRTVTGSAADERFRARNQWWI